MIAPFEVAPELPSLLDLWPLLVAWAVVSFVVSYVVVKIGSWLAALVRNSLCPTCDVAECDGEPEPLAVEGGVALLCPEHMLGYFEIRSKIDAIRDDDPGIQHPRECPECGATTYQFERCHECGDVPWKEEG